MVTDSMSILASFYKTIAIPDRGVNFGLEPHAIEPRCWLTMQQMRARLGRVENFPGWKSLLVSGNVGGFGSLIREFRMFDGTLHLMVGGPTKLWRWDEPTSLLVDLSEHAYAPDRDNPWMSFMFGNAFYVTNLIDGMQVWDGVAATFVGVPEAPKSRSAGILNDYICLLNTDDGVDPSPYRFQWAAEGTDDEWTASPTIDAGAFDLFDTPDFGVALYRFGPDIIAYKEKTIIPITFIGGNEVFGRRAAVAGVGLLGPYSIVPMGDTHVLMGPDTFYAYTGGNTADDSIGDAIRDKVYGELHHTYKNRSHGIYLKEFFEIIFFYPSTSSTGELNRAVVYNTKDGTWYGPFDVSTTLSGNFDFRRDSLPIDSFIDNNGVLMQIGPLQSANGVGITRQLESGDHSLQLDSMTKAGQQAFFPIGAVFMVVGISIEFKASVLAQSVQFYVGYRMELNDPIVYAGPYNFNAAAGQEVTVPVRATGRWFRVKFDIPDSKQFTLLGYQYEFERVGVR